MSDVVVCGAGICGLGTALMLAADGHEVTLLEGDANPLPPSGRQAWDTWSRSGVAHFRQPHNFMPGLRQILKAELPEIDGELPKAGAYRWDMIGRLLPLLPDPSARPDDDRFQFWTARRPAGEFVFARAAEDHPRIRVRRGARAAGLLCGTSVRSGIPHVTGVCTADGEEIAADAVVDAMGRRSKACDWLVAAGARPPDETSADSGFSYYTRYFSGTVPEMIGPPLAPIGSISILRLPGDNDTWSITIFATSADRPLKRLKDADVWTKVIEACPLHAPWIGEEPISDVLPYSGIMDRYRRFVVEDRPVATGFFAVADAWACTNPSAGRGLTVGFKHAVCLRDVLRDGECDPYEQARRFHEETETKVAPWYWSQIAVDRARIAEIGAITEGRPTPTPSDPLVTLIQDLGRFLLADADIARALISYAGTITPIQEIAKQDWITERLSDLKASADTPPAAIPGPDRGQLLDLLI